MGDCFQSLVLAEVEAERVGGVAAQVSNWLIVQGIAKESRQRSASTGVMELDLVIVMLGSNDLKWEGRQRAIDARLGMARLVEIIKTYVYKPGCSIPKILLLAPPHLAKTDDEDFAGYFEHAMAESKNFAYQYAKLAKEADCHFFDAASVAKADPLDGIHLDADNTRAIGTALIPVVRRILNL